MVTACSAAAIGVDIDGKRALKSSGRTGWKMGGGGKERSFFFLSVEHRTISEGNAKGERRETKSI